MSDVHNLTSQHWQMQLPSDWREESDHLEGAIYFVSGDDSKGMYIGTWQFDNDPRTAEQLLKHFEKVQLEQNSDAEAQWKVLQVRTSSSGAVHSLTLDSYDEANKYRVILRVLAQPPFVVRAAFHDYYCEDLAESSGYFEPIIGSLKLVAAQPSVPPDVPAAASRRQGRG
jgi:hypothetical protein